MSEYVLVAAAIIAVSFVVLWLAMQWFDYRRARDQAALRRSKRRTDDDR